MYIRNINYFNLVLQSQLIHGIFNGLKYCCYVMMTHKQIFTFQKHGNTIINVFLNLCIFIKYKYIHGNFHPYTLTNALNAETGAMNQPIIIQTGGDKSLSFAPLLARPHALSLVSHPLHGRLTSDPDPSPSLWVLIICLSVKHQRPSSPPLSAAVSLASGTLRDSSRGSHH